MNTDDGPRPVPAWSLVTSHGLVLLYVAMNEEATIRQIAEQLGLTERRVADIIRDLAMENLVTIQRVGRHNHYSLSRNARFRHPIIKDLSFRAFVSLRKRALARNRLGHRAQRRS